MRDKIVLEKARNEGLALTFDDVRLRSNYAEDMPDEVDVGSKFSRNVRLKIPIVSAAMDNVTEYGLAIELAKLGGIGVIHRKNISIKDQVSHVEKVKYHLNGLIEKPIWVYEDESVFSILSRREEKGYTFHSFPVLNREGKLVGIITGNDFEFCRNSSLKAKDIMTTELLLAPMGTTIDEAYDKMCKAKKKILPLVKNNGEIVGMYVFSDVKRIKTRSAETYNVDSKGQLRVAAAVGTGEEAFERVARLSEKNVDVIVIDTAHGDSKYVIDTLKEIKRNYSLDVVVGNVSIGESAKRLVNAGADGIKVGQGPGSICTTRVIAGIGRPQVSAVYDCAKAIEESDIPICADGGLRNSGDITIAIAAGAHSVMMGSMLAGTEEAPGNIIFVEGRQWKSYRGMGSLGAMEISGSSRERYLQQQTEKNQLIPEGVEGLAPYKGRLADVIFQYIGGLRRGMGYVGAASIEELRNKGDFDRITTAGFSESHPHDIKIIKESPNYRKDE
ncbi:IMP dehydrogenase [Candidatus Pacearchaeota archaeon]|nr:IMP dehydrogenase [Candidatus Pacearchaeota archaeon]